MSDFWAKAREEFAHLFPDNVKAPSSERSPSVRVSSSTRDAVDIHFLSERGETILALTYHWSHDFFLLSPCHGSVMDFTSRRFHCHSCKEPLSKLTDTQFNILDSDSSQPQRLIQEWLELTMNTLEASLVEVEIQNWLRDFHERSSLMRREFRLDYNSEEYADAAQFNAEVAEEFTGSVFR